MKPIVPLCLSALLLAACSKPAANPQAATKPSGPPPVPVSVVPARTMELQRSVRITGSLVGLETATLSNRVPGRVTKIYVDRGDWVKPGQKLLEIEPDRFRMGVEESKAALEQTLARLGIKEVPGDNFDVNRTAPVKKAQADYDLAKDKFDRATPLNRSGAMTDFEYLDAVSKFKAAESSLEASRDDARALLAQARQNNSQMAIKQKDFDDSVLVSPDGTTPDNAKWGIKIESYAVTDRKTSVGEYIREGTPVFTLVADSTLKLQARVPERYLGDVKQGAQVSFEIAAFPRETFAGKVAIIDPSVEQASRTFLIEAVVDNVQYQNKLRPGSFVQGMVLTKKEAGRIMVPQEAVTSFVGVTKVYKIDKAANPTKVKAITITTGQQEQLRDESGKTTNWVEILTLGKGQELTPADTVVITGLAKLVDGTVVSVGDPAAPAAPPATGPQAAAQP